MADPRRATQVDRTGDYLREQAMQKKAKERKESQLGRLQGRDAIDDYVEDEEKQALELMWQEVPGILRPNIYDEKYKFGVPPDQSTTTSSPASQIHLSSSTSPPPGFGKINCTSIKLNHHIQCISNVLPLFKINRCRRRSSSPL